MQKKKNQCPCCLNYTLDDDIWRFDICPVCNWEDDWIQRDDIDYWWWANVLSLREARENYKNFWWSDPVFKDSVRLPRESEK